MEISLKMNLDFLHLNMSKYESMDCSKCNAKCCKQNWLVRLTEEERDSEFFDDSMVYYGFLQLPCEYLKDNKCSIYSNRPQVCRQYACEGDKRLKEVV